MVLGVLRLFRLCLVIAGARIGRLFSACEFACLCDSLLLCLFVWLFGCLFVLCRVSVPRSLGSTVAAYLFACLFASDWFWDRGLVLFVCLHACVVRPFQATEGAEAEKHIASLHLSLLEGARRSAVV